MQRRLRERERRDNGSADRLEQANDCTTIHLPLRDSSAAFAQLSLDLVEEMRPADKQEVVRSRHGKELLELRLLFCGASDQIRDRKTARFGTATFGELFERSGLVLAEAGVVGRRAVGQDDKQAAALAGSTQEAREKERRIRRDEPHSSRS